MENHNVLLWENQLIISMIAILKLPEGKAH